ncbi:uncharacterized protein LOC129005396 [Macrosteles quadrilineatus]|uniref:uncharacterized protein LOC129005396 n=1 Tax=Macrosteles quadrilineatus TaxID=74068 RepID=UPI0023E2CD3D|nr:uncharacterized protein LOC129005396 [Macrosteles quadrilineatus]
MTIHWLDPSTLERRSMGIGCRRILGQHTYDVIADAIESILDDFEIKNKCSMMITDNGSNFLRAFRLFGGSGPDSDLCCEDTEEIDGGDIVPDPDIIAIAPILEDSDDYGRLPPHHPCAAHTLNLLATTDAEAAKCDPAYRKIMRLAFAKCHAIFNKQNKSPLAADIIKKHLGRHFLVPGANRWNSQFDAIELLVKSEDKLDSLCKDLDLPMFKRPQEIEFLAEYCKVMEPIAQALDILQGEKEMYMGFLLPTLTVVKSVLTSLPELQWCEPLKHALLKGFDKRFSKYFENKEFEIAACLIPRFKLIWVPHLAERQTIRNTLSDEFLKAVRKEPSTRTTTAGSKAPPESKNTKIDKFFSVIDVPKESNGNTDCSQMERAKAESELAHYLNDSVDVKEMSELCKNLFIKFNTAVPSSAHCERLFSAASLVITNRRGSDTNFEKQVLLKFNRHLK